MVQNTGSFAFGLWLCLCDPDAAADHHEHCTIQKKEKKKDMERDDVSENSWKGRERVSKDSNTTQNESHRNGKLVGRHAW